LEKVLLAEPSGFEVPLQVGRPKEGAENSEGFNSETFTYIKM
jgi:hypothetical protein